VYLEHLLLSWYPFRIYRSDLGTTTSQKRASVSKRARIQGSQTCASLNSRLESNNEGEEGFRPHLLLLWFPSKPTLGRSSGFGAETAAAQCDERTVCRTVRYRSPPALEALAFFGFLPRALLGLPNPNPSTLARRRYRGTSLIRKAHRLVYHSTF